MTFGAWSPQRRGRRGALSSACPVLAILTIGYGPTAAAQTIGYRLARAGDVSLAVYDDRGVMVRELLRAKHQDAGEHVVAWDGRDRGGKPLPSGGYLWKLLETGGLYAEYLLSVGGNYPIGVERGSAGGPGSHLGPFAAAWDPSGIYVAAAQTENIESVLIKLGPDGKTRLWSQQLPADAGGKPVVWEGARSIVSDGAEVFLLGHRAPQRVHVSDARTGAPRRAFPVGWPGAEERPSGKDLAADGVADIALDAGAIVAAYRSRSAVRWFDAATGACLATARVRTPSKLAVNAAGDVFVTSGDRILRLTRRHRAPTTLPIRLETLGPITVDPTTGELLVFEGGLHQQVLRLSPSGAVRARYGMPGGRRDGLYVPTDFRDVTALAADGAGGFFVAEPYAAPRRVAHFDPTGAVTQEWYGGQPWDTSAAIEPGRPDVMWVVSATGLDGAASIMRVVVDYPARTWRVHSCFHTTGPGNPLMHGSGNEGNFFHVYQHQGTNYLVAEAEPSIWKIDEEHWRLLPATVVGGDFQWNDANGDGLVQDAEKVPYQGRVRRTFLVPHVADNFDYFFVSNNSETCRIRRVPVTSWTPTGAPVYGGDPDGDVYASCPARFEASGANDARWAAFLHFDAGSGNLYAAFNPGTTDWCTSRDSFVEAWNADGRPLWEVGELPASPAGRRVYRYVPVEPGRIYWNLRGIAGVAHGSLVAVDVDGGWTTERAQTYVWDRDGLYVGGLMDHPDLRTTPEFMYHLGGEFAHAALTTTAAGDVIFIGNWENEVRAYRITGWDSASSPWVRTSGRLTIGLH